MNTKTTNKTFPPFRYTPEEVAARDLKEDGDFVEGFVARNRDAINAGLKAARDSIRSGKGKRYASTDDLADDVMSDLAQDSRKT